MPKRQHRTPPWHRARRPRNRPATLTASPFATDPRADDPALRAAYQHWWRQQQALLLRLLAQYPSVPWDDPLKTTPVADIRRAQAMGRAYSQNMEEWVDAVNARIAAQQRRLRAALAVEREVDAVNARIAAQQIGGTEHDWETTG